MPGIVGAVARADGVQYVLLLDDLDARTCSLLYGAMLRGYSVGQRLESGVPHSWAAREPDNECAAYDLIICAHSGAVLQNDDDFAVSRVPAAFLPFLPITSIQQGINALALRKIFRGANSNR
jgi:hypothetical protein